MRTLLLLLIGVRVAVATPVAPPLRAIDSPSPIEIRIGPDKNADAPRGLPKAFRATQRILDDFRRSESRRFLLLTDLSDKEAAVHLQLLERSAHAVEDFRSRLSLSTAGRNVDRKMLAVAFSSRADFLWFARQQDGLDADWMSGYFAPISGRLVYYHAQDLPGIQRAVRTLEQRGNQREALASLASFLSKSTAAVVVHEAVHMILHEEGIMPANSSIPLWLAEGIAASFEPVVASRSFGPFKRENGRTQSFQEDLESDQAPPLQVLVGSLSLPGGGEDAVRSFYDASAALCSWLARVKPDAMARFIQACCLGSAGHDRTSRIEAFELHVGPIGEIEAMWLSEYR